MKAIDSLKHGNEIWKLKVVVAKATSIKVEIPKEVKDIINNPKEYKVEEIGPLGINLLIAPSNQWRKTLDRLSIKRLELLRIIEDCGSKPIDKDLLTEIVAVLNENKLLSINNLKYHMFKTIVYIHALSGQITAMSTPQTTFKGLKELKLPYVFWNMLNNHNTLMGMIKNSNHAFTDYDELTKKVYSLIISKHLLLRRLNDYLGEITKESETSNKMVSSFITLYHRNISATDIELYIVEIENHAREVQQLLHEVQTALETL